MSNCKVDTWDHHLGVVMVGKRISFKKVKKLPSLPREKNGRKTDQRNREKDWLLSFFPRDQEILTAHVNTWHNSI